MAKKKKIVVKHVDAAKNTQVIKTAFLEAVPEMIEIGAVGGMWSPIRGDQPAFYVEDKEGRVIGLLQYFFDEDDDSGWVNLGWVKKEYRGKGIYRAMWNKFEKATLKHGGKKVCGLVVAGNEPMEKAAAAMGRKITSSVWTKELR